MLGFDFDVTGTETVRQTGQTFLEKLRSENREHPFQQSATPFSIASDITGLALRYHPGTQIRFLEPCLGTGIFFSAFLHEADNRSGQLQIRSAHGVEHEEQFAALAHDLWAPAGLTVHELDFMALSEADLPKATMVLSRPPATQHHRLSSDDKIRAADAAEAATQLRPTGLTDLYNYYVLATHKFLADGAVSAWLLPTKFLHHTAGRALRTYLTRQVRLQRIHNFDSGALGVQGHREEILDWSVVVFTNEAAQPTDTVELTAGGEIFGAETSTTATHAELADSSEWHLFWQHGEAAQITSPLLEDFFFIRRGWEIPGGKFFIQSENRAWALGIQPFHMHPLLPPPDQVDTKIIGADDWGYPEGDNRRVVLTSHDDLYTLEEKDPAFRQYLETADDETKAAAQRPDSSRWYSLHLRRPAPILVQPATEQDPGPFRFIINESNGIAGPGWVTMTPNLGFAKPWFLNHDVDWHELVEVLESIPTPDPPAKPELSPSAVAALDATAVADWLASCD
ncbi:MAG TPA: hypothetical protein VIG82_07085 [Enteractinococcus sp.]